jgi:hypothetical protein
VPAIVSTVRNEHRGWLDHIAVLDHPLPPAPRIDSAPASRPAGPLSSAPVAEPLPLCAVHHDLLLFGPVAQDEDPRERAEFSDD